MNVVITGSSRGIGFSLAKEFLKSGHSVMINGRNREFLSEQYNKLRQEFPNSIIHLYACDVSCYNSVSRMFWEAKRYFGSIEIWINNAGINQSREYLHNHNNSEIEKVINTNLYGTIWGTKVAINGMLEKGGYIYNLEGFGSNNLKAPKTVLYGTSKNAISYFTKSTALELKKTKVKIGLLSPGMVSTSFLINSLPKENKERVKVVSILNILADRAEKVTPYLVKKILKNNKNNISIKWLTTKKIIFRFIISIFYKRRIISE